MKLTFFFLHLFVVSNLSFAQAPAQALDLKAVVGIHLDDSYRSEHDFLCSGVLVSPTIVLTSGHCIDVIANEVYEQWSIFGYRPELLKVKIAGMKVEVADVIYAPSYFEALGFHGEDLALIKLKKPTLVRPLKIAPLTLLKAETKAFMISPRRIRETKLTTVKSFSGHSVVFMKDSACAGDSGGALLVKSGAEYLLAGILSPQSKECTEEEGVSIYPRLF